MKKYLPLIFVLIIAGFLRLYNLGQMPYGMSNDEAGYIYNAYSIVQTGKDVNGILLPLSFNVDNPFSPVPVYLIALVLKILPLNLFSGRLIFSLLGIGCVYLLYLLTKELFNNNKISLISSFILAISPWHLHISRVAYEGGLALFFYLLAILVFLKNSKKGNILFSLSFFLLAFYSYHATKVFFIPLLIILIYTNKSILNNKKQFVLFTIGIILIIGSFAVILKSQNAGGRASTFIFNNLGQISETVKEERTSNIAPFLIRQIFSNKFTVILRTMRENYLTAFSPEYLFLYGETGGNGELYGTFFRGEMYLVELPLLIIGAYCLWRFYPKQRKFILLSLLAAPLTTTFTTDVSYTIRAIMMIPFLSILVAIGIVEFFKFIQNFNKLKYYFWGTIFCLVYLVSLFSYLYLYHYRYSVYGAEAWFRSSRDLVSYIELNQDKFDEIHIIKPGNMFLLQYGVFSQSEPEDIQKAWSSPSVKKVDKIVIENDCPVNLDLITNKIWYVVPENCFDLPNTEKVIKDYGEPLRDIWRIYNL